MTTAISLAVRTFAQSIQAGSKVIDIGCGLQPYRDFFNHTEYIGIDVETSGRTPQDKSADIYFDGIHIPLESESVDAVICTEVLEHAVNLEALVEEMYRVLRKNGKICITVPFMWGLHEIPYDFRRFTNYGLANLVTSKGFIINFQEKMVTGVSAINMLINSEINNYMVNIYPAKKASNILNIRIHLALFLHAKLMRILLFIWRNNFQFDRIYIDNLLVAHK